MNKVILIGRLGIDPELKSTSSGKAVCNFTLATNDFKENTEWHKVTAWEKTADLVCQYVKKGDQLAVTGRIAYRKYEDKYFTDIIAESIEFIGGKKDEGDEPRREQQKDDIPF